MATTKTHKTSLDKRRDVAARYAATAQGLTLTRSRADGRYRLWRETDLGEGRILRESVGGPESLTLTDVEALLTLDATPALAG